MTRLRRLLEAVAAGVALLLAAVLATGGWTIGGLALTRPEDLVVLLSGIVALRAWIAPIRLPAMKPARAVAVGVAAYALLMGFIVVTRHLALRTHALDLGYYVQLVWSIGTGRGAYVTLPPMHHAWGDHFSPVLYVLAPLGWLAPGGTALLLAQTLILAAGAFAVFGYAVRRLGVAPPAAAFALLYLANPSLHGTNIRDIHPQAFAVPLLIGAALAFDARRHAWCVAALALTLAGRDDAAVAVVGFGIWLAAARGRWGLGAAVAAASVLILMLDVKYVVPYFRAEPYAHLGRWAHLGSSLGEILVSAVARPWLWIGLTLTGEKLVYLLAMLAPLGFLPLFAPRAALAAVPGLAMNLVSFDPILLNYRTQYQSFVLPFFVLAAIDGYANLRQWQSATGEAAGGPRGLLHRLSMTATGALTVAFIASAALTARTANDLAVTRWVQRGEQRAAHRLMRQIPPSAAVSANERLVPHLAARREVAIYPVGVGRSDYVLDLETTVAHTPPPGYREIGQGGGWVLLGRGP